jgi:VWFA-related protein
VLQVSRLIAIAVAVWLAQSGPPATPQGGAQQPRQPPRFRGGTNFVRVDTYASKDGAPVQDLTAQDFEVLEDNVPQKIETFEHIVVSPAGPGAGLIEPASPSEANQLAADPRRRVFVVFLDTHNVPVDGSHRIKEPLIDLMQRVMGDDDLVGVMTPDMSPSQITFGRRTEVIERGLRDNWYWGRRESIIPDKQERFYEECFPPANTEDTMPSRLAKAMKARRMERVVLDSLRDLVSHMYAIREGRTAVITVTAGWLLYRPDLTLLNLRKDDRGYNADPLPGTPIPVGVGPGGTLSKSPNPESYITDRTVCDSERAALAMMDDDLYFKMIYGDANRANVSFYTIDPRGLVVFDQPIGPEPPPTLEVDHAMRVQRENVLETLARATDGLSLRDSNDLRKQLRRIADDLTSYYLIGYYSTNAKPDGRFHQIKVKSKRPGIEIRARNGYTSATADDVAKARAAAAPPEPEAKVALTKALGTIETDVRAQGRPTARVAGAPVLFHRGLATGNQVQPAAGRVFPRSERIRVELEAAAGTPAWTGALLDRTGARTAVPVTTGDRTDASTGQRWLTADITLAPLGPGDYVVELMTTQGTEQKRTLVAIRVTQ